jgi:hypothetical protein
MTHRVLCLLLAGGVVLAGLTFAADDPQGPEEPPVRLKKKNKLDAAKPEPKAEEKPQPEKPPMPPAEDKKPEAQPKEGDMGNPAEEDEQEVLDRVARTMKAVQNRLANKELNDSTRQMQEDILKDLDSLIKMNENPSDGGGGGADNNNQDQQNQDQQNQGEKGQQGQQGQKKQQGRLGQRGQQQRQMAQGKQQGQRRQGSRQQAKGQPNGQQTGNQQAQANQPQQPKPNTSNPGNAGIHDPSGMPRRDTDVFKDAWGHLPEALRAQMNAYSSREQYMEKHQDLIAQYYKSIAAQGRKKGN